MPASNERLARALNRSTSHLLTARRRRVQVLSSSALLGLVGGIVFVACSTAPNARPNSTGSGAGGASVGTGINVHPGAGGADTIGGNVDDAGNVPLTSCDSNDACPGGAGTQICVTTAGGGKCSANGGACDPKNDTCQNDSYCCAGTCRVDGKADGVCVTGGTRPKNDMCRTDLVIGVFSPELQCQWPPLQPAPASAPDAGTTPIRVPMVPAQFPKSVQVLTTPLVGDMPSRPAGSTWSNIIIVTSDSISGAAAGDGTGGRIRILNGKDCTEESVITDGPPVRDAATPAIADLDNDGTMEIVTHENFPNNNKIVAFKWMAGSFKVMWEATGAANIDAGAWDGVSVHDLNDDGFPEVIARYGEVYDGRTGKQLTAGGGPIILESDPVLGDVDHDGKVELIANKVFTWSGTGWTEKYPGVGATTRAQAFAYYAFGDFGTRNADGTFDHTKKDGIAEIVAAGAHLGTTGIDETTGSVGIYTLQGEALMRVDFPQGPVCRTGQSRGERGGPPTIGNFIGTGPNNPNGMPQLATAGAYAYRVFDLACKDPNSGCQDPTKLIRWAQPSQDCSSGSTGSTIFDFEGDGAAEAIYADECFVRVYSGKTGEVLFSVAHTTATWAEQNIVADPDHSDRSKIIFSNAAEASAYSNCNAGTPDRSPAITTDQRFNGMVDPTYKGLRCATNEDCPSNSCVMGYCRCAVHTDGTPPDIECGNDYNPAMLSDFNDSETGFICTTPLAGTPGTGNVCRMQHGNVATKPVADNYFSGIRVYRDKLDRWASSRAMWNQHAYSVTNINDDGKIPKTSEWQQNFTDPKLNNFRENRQGATSQDLADITGSVDATDACQLTKTGGVLFHGKICNRGLRGVGSSMPARFYSGTGEAAALDAPLCSTQTDGPVAVGSCKPITCEIMKGQIPDGSTITMVVNDAGGGKRLVDECNYVNNTSSVAIGTCSTVN